MGKYMTKSKTTQMSEMQHAEKALQSGSVSTPVLTHKEIAKRAYEIYVESGCRQDQSEQDWLQAEQELKNKQHWMQTKQN